MPSWLLRPMRERSRGRAFEGNRRGPEFAFRPTFAACMLSQPGPTTNGVDISTPFVVGPKPVHPGDGPILPRGWSGSFLRAVVLLLLSTLHYFLQRSAC